MFELESIYVMNSGKASLRGDSAGPHLNFDITFYGGSAVCGRSAFEF